MSEFKSDTARLINNFMVGILIIICVLAVLGAVFGIPYMVQKGNGDKVENLTNACISKGYDGWRDGFEDDDRERAVSGCYNDVK